ncbi:MAG: fatty acid desaturase [Rhodobacteraceae bacterium]|nr:fatty acid desaturase [Paracoccaceae bacterium]
MTAAAKINPGRPRRVEWLTLSLIAACYALWAQVTLWLAALSPALALACLALLIAFHSSLQHEVIHGHPLPDRKASEWLVFPALGLFIPYCRFRDLHLQHHWDPKLTDPYEDPETNYLDPAVWDRLPEFLRLILRFNNSLFGRMLIGPLISQFTFMADDWRRIRSGEAEILHHWLLHAAGAAPVILWIYSLSQLSVPAYLLAAYAGLSLLKIRTFLEHRAHTRPTGRTVVINDRGWLALLFLNNNFHIVHHMNPTLPWYELPKLFDSERERILQVNDGYMYDSYRTVFANFLLKPKDPVPHPLWPES